MILRASVLLICALCLAACGMAPAELPETGGMRSGPGLLSGPTGELVLERRP
jgi:hypothetical protein